MTLQRIFMLRAIVVQLEIVCGKLSICVAPSSHFSIINNNNSIPKMVNTTGVPHQPIIMRRDIWNKYTIGMKRLLVPYKPAGTHKRMFREVNDIEHTKHLYISRILYNIVCIIRHRRHFMTAYICWLTLAPCVPQQRTVQ